MWPFKRKNRSFVCPDHGPEPTASASPFVEKRRVTMFSLDGHRAVDFVPLAILDAYVKDAETRWHSVTVGSVHDSGPGGDYGPTASLPHLETPNVD